MWVELVVNPHLAPGLFLWVLWFSNLTTIDNQLRLMWIEFVVGPHLVLRLFNSSGSLVFQFDHNRSPAKTDVD